MGNIIFAVCFFTFGLLFLVTPIKMLKYRSGLKKDDKIEFEWYRILFTRISGILFIIVGLMLIIDLYN